VEQGMKYKLMKPAFLRENIIKAELFEIKKFGYLEARI
jgi:hypothetical protein